MVFLITKYGGRNDEDTMNNNGYFERMGKKVRYMNDFRKY